MGKYDALKLSNQLCFPLYAAAKELIRLYKPHLDPLGLTYTQYITMLALWEHGSLSVKQLGRLLLLDSGTLTPLLKKLEAAGFLTRKRDTQDERNVLISLTDKGLRLRDRAILIPQKLIQCLPLTTEESITLYNLLYKTIPVFDSRDKD